MYHHRIQDWDNAYTNGANIAGGDRWPDAWMAPAKAYRDANLAAGKAKLDLSYGDRPRNRLDLFLPVSEPNGLVVFIHGGYWMRFDQSFWSHLAKGAVDSGYAVAMPTYTLCPENRISGIVAEMGQAVEKMSGMVGGPIHLTGHSAGGHLATRLVCTNSPLSGATRDRIRNVVSISGLHDLRPMMRTAMNETLRIDQCRGACRKPCLPRADRECPRHLLGRRRRALRIHPPERAARQCLGRRRRRDGDGRGARSAPSRHHRRACRSRPTP